MISLPDFEKKQVVFVMASQGDRVSLLNDNLIVKDKDGTTKLQCTCWRLFIVFILGGCSLTTPLIQAAKKFGFFFVIMTSGFRLIDVIGASKDGNTLLKMKQYEYQGLEIAKHIVANKVGNSIRQLMAIRNKSEYIKDGIAILRNVLKKIPQAESREELMAYEGIASKAYFERFFVNCGWKGRKPRLKEDCINSILDVGYTLLFNFIDAILSCYGFDTYKGILHTQFYMRKSLVCDIIEPFRVIVDHAVRKAYNLGQILQEDFLIQEGQFKLKWQVSGKYVKIIMSEIIGRKQEIFLYIQSYYRSFMKGVPADTFPVFEV